MKQRKSRRVTGARPYARRQRACAHQPEGGAATAPPESDGTHPAHPPRRVRERIRYRHYSYRTEQAYVEWVRRFVRFHGRRHPREMGAPEIEAFLTHLANERDVAASTHNQALSALLFLYGEVLGVDLPWLGDIVRAKRPQRLPVVLTREEVARRARALDGIAA